MTRLSPKRTDMLPPCRPRLHPKGPPSPVPAISPHGLRGPRAFEGPNVAAEMGVWGRGPGSGGGLASKRHQAEAEGLGFVGGLFDEGYGIATPQSADGGIPGQADADRSARSGRVARQ